MAQSSLDDMAEELTCSICLCLFTTPVTIPCGHNFCHQCLELTWKGVLFEEYNCPQCRYNFESKPDLRKNTLLSNLVSQLIVARGNNDPDVTEEAEEDIEEEVDKLDLNAVLCDHCMKAQAVMTCLTCMVSYCNDHLQPHLESPAFKDHNLKQPLKDLQQRKCQEHNKLLDCYCWDHSKCICCNCLVGHKQCQTHSLHEGKEKKELHFKNILRSLREKVEKASNASEEVKVEQRRILDVTKKKKALIEGEFDEIKALIEEEQKKATRKIEEEEKKVNSKFNFTQSVLSKKKKEFQSMKDKVESLLEEEDELQFLKRATKLHDTTSKDPYKPKNEFDEKLLNQIYRNTVSLKDTIKMKLVNPDETPEWRKTKSNMNQPEAERPPSQSDSSDRPSMPNKFSEAEKPTKKNKPKPPKTSAGPSPAFGYGGCASPAPAAGFGGLAGPAPAFSFGGFAGPAPPAAGFGGFAGPAPPAAGFGGFAGPAPPAAGFGGFAGPVPPAAGKFGASHPSKAKKNSGDTSSTLNIPSSREEILRYAEHLTVDPNTAHRRVILSDRNTKVTVTDTPQNYKDNPQRFTHCSQVLCTKGFNQGVHYWEVDIEGGNFSGIGVAYQSIARKGTESRLGRNKFSWCIEWFNGKLQAWHADKMTDLTSPNTNKIGVLLNNDDGYVCFFSVSKKFSQIHRFRAKFTEPLYPAFWVFSSNTILSISSLQ
ncbi:E3 ubiquitin/ISG15 ligase TRIM25 [Discoglossus pictus]